MNVAVFGLGKLGAPLAVLLASKGHTVAGYDVDPRPAQLLAQGVSPVREPGMDERLAAMGGSFRAAATPQEAVVNSTMSFVVVPTPSDDSGAFSAHYAEQAAVMIGRALRHATDHHLVVLSSTVMPGQTRGAFVPALEAAAGEACGARFGVCYNPEFVALGSVLRDLVRPDLVLIGEADPHCGARLEAFYREFCENEPAIDRMTFENAELAKLALNTFVTMKITFANALADMCERLPTGDIDAVTNAVGVDSRVGRKYLRGGLGYGGPCFPRDVLAYTSLARRLGVAASLAEATHLSNQTRLDALVATALGLTTRGSSIGVLGLSYKPGTPVIECSPAVDLASRLARAGRAVMVFDPMAMDEARPVLGNRVTYAKDVEQIVAEGDVLVIATNWPEFQQLPLAQLGSRARRATIVDCWRVLDPDVYQEVADIRYIGRAGASAVAEHSWRE
jgi:UDPglucose 6-dehydrogenase